MPHPKTAADPADELHALYFEAALQDVATLEALLAALGDDPAAWAAAQRHMREIAHNIHGQGSSFGYPLMTRVGHSLSRLLKAIGPEGAPDLALLGAHVKVLRTVLDKDIRGDGGELGAALVARLEALVEAAG